MASYSSMTGNQRIVVEMTLIGGPRFAAEMNTGTASVDRFNRAVDRTAVSTRAASEKAFLMRQGIFTLRRGMFYATLASAGLVYSVAKLGWEFNNTMQTARVGFTSIMGSSAAADKELKQLYITAALTPFQFPDIVMGTRRILAFSHNVRQTNLLVTGLTNALSRTGLISAQYLGRASLALGHMFAQGRLTGRVLYQMAADNIPMQEALQRQFHMTGEEIRQSVAAGQISAQQAAQALINLTQTPAYKNAAKMQATKTLVGSWSTFLDFMRMASATSQGGVFGFLTKNLRGIDLALEPLARGTKPLTLMMLVDVIDKQLSPKTHIIINLFYFLKGVVEGITTSFYLLLKGIQLLLRPFDRLFNLFGGNKVAAEALGFVYGILIARLILVTAWTAAAAAANVLYEDTGLKVIWVNRLIWVSYFKLLWQVRALIFQMALLRIETLLLTDSIGGWRNALLYIIRTLRTGGLIAGVRALGIVLRTVLFPAFLEAAAGAWALTIALLANPITWIVLAVLALTYGLVILYIRWKAFRDLVNETATWIKNHWAYLLEILMPGLGIGLTILIRYWGSIVSMIKAAYHWAVRLFDKMASPLKGPWHILGQAAHYASYALPPGMGGPSAHQTGGIVPGNQWAVVGERGPEMVALPGGSRITPSYGVSSLAMPFRGGGGSDRPILVQVMLDRKVLAQGVARANQDYASRR